MKETAMQELKWFISDGLDNFDESVKVSEIWTKINELLEMEKQQGYSEEDLEKAFHIGRLYKGREGDTTFKDWFEQFKNK